MKNAFNPYQLLGADYDTPAGTSGPQVKSILICTTPRTGGHTLNEAFINAEWGVTMEYFNPDCMIPLQQRWFDKSIANFVTASSNLERYGQFLLSNRSRGGVFSAKIFPRNVPSLDAAIPITQSSRNHVHLFRQDKIKQTISLAVTLLTKRAFDGEQQLKYLSKISDLDEPKMIEIFEWLKACDAFWNKYFLSIDPACLFTLSTEDLVANPKNQLNQIAEKFGLPSWRLAAINIIDAPYKMDSNLKAELTNKFKPILEKLV